jgi:hypothetical protein
MPITNVELLKLGLRIKASRKVLGRNLGNGDGSRPSNRIGFRYERFSVFRICLVLPEERYLIEVQTRKPDSGELRGQEEIEGIAKECLALVIGEGHADVVKEVKPNSISESGAQKLTKVQ